MKFLNWLKKIFLSAFNFVKKLVVEVVTNVEAVIILSFSAIGLTTILAEIPFHIAMPAFIEGALFIPVISVLIIVTLLSIMSWRTAYAVQ